MLTFTVSVDMPDLPFTKDDFVKRTVPGDPDRVMIFHVYDMWIKGVFEHFPGNNNTQHLVKSITYALSLQYDSKDMGPEGTIIYLDWLDNKWNPEDWAKTEYDGEVTEPNNNENFMIHYNAWRARNPEKA